MSRRALRLPNLVAGGALTGLVLALALVSLVWTPYPLAGIDIAGRFQPPGPQHWLGTDQYGRDVLSMIMVGAQGALGLGLVAVGIGLAGGVPLGLVAAVRRGWLDEAIGRVTDLGFAFPTIILAVLITALAGPGAVNAILAIGLFNIAVFARVTRAAARQVWALPFVRAALALGRSRRGIVFRHVLPNIATALIVQATVQFAVAVLAEAALNYLGIGAQPPRPSWGRMLFEAQSLLYLAPGQAIAPGAAIALAVLGLNLLGDGLRDLLDPRLAPQRLG